MNLKHKSREKHQIVSLGVFGTNIAVTCFCIFLLLFFSPICALIVSDLRIRCGYFPCQKKCIFFKTSCYDEPMPNGPPGGSLWVSLQKYQVPH